MRAPRLLLATGAYHAGLPFGSKAAYTPVWYFNFATDPLASKYDHILQHRPGCWDTALLMTSFGRDQDGRLVIGSVGKLDRLGKSTHHAWAKRKLAELFPQLRTQEFKHAWHGSIAMSKDHLPRVVKLGPSAISIYGYSGRGIAPGTLFGRAAARYYKDGDASHFAVPVIEKDRLVGAGLREAYYKAGSLVSLTCRG